MKQWTSKERKEIARLRKAGHTDQYISGWMKGGRKSNQIPPVTQRSKKMVTKKKSKKKASKKKTTASRKAKGKAGRKPGGFQVGETLTVVTGQDDHFYKQFPRYKAYQLLCKKKKMATSAFVDQVEKLDGVNTRSQALGILTKLLDKGCAKASGTQKAA